MKCKQVIVHTCSHLVWNFSELWFALYIEALNRTWHNFIPGCEKIPTVDLWLVMSQCIRICKEVRRVDTPGVKFHTDVMFSFEASNITWCFHTVDAKISISVISYVEISNWTRRFHTPGVSISTERLVLSQHIRSCKQVRCVHNNGVKFINSMIFFVEAFNSFELYAFTPWLWKF